MCSCSPLTSGGRGGVSPSSSQCKTWNRKEFSWIAWLSDIHTLPLTCSRSGRPLLPERRFRGRAFHAGEGRGFWRRRPLGPARPASQPCAGGERPSEQRAAGLVRLASPSREGRAFPQRPGCLLSASGKRVHTGTGVVPGEASLSSLDDFLFNCCNQVAVVF